MEGLALSGYCVMLLFLTREAKVKEDAKLDKYYNICMYVYHNV